MSDTSRASAQASPTPTSDCMSRDRPVHRGAKATVANIQVHSHSPMVLGHGEALVGHHHISSSTQDSPKTPQDHRPHPESPEYLNLCLSGSALFQGEGFNAEVETAAFQRPLTRAIHKKRTVFQKEDSTE